MIGKENLRNVVVEAANARDPGLLDRLEIEDRQLLTERLEVIQQRWPRLMMTRGDIGDVPVAVVWMPDHEERYQPVAHVEFTLDGDDPYMTIIEGRDPDLVAERPPPKVLPEWESVPDADSGEGEWV